MQKTIQREITAAGVVTILIALSVIVGRQFGLDPMAGKNLKGFVNPTAMSGFSPASTAAGCVPMNSTIKMPMFEWTGQLSPSAFNSSPSPTVPVLQRLADRCTAMGNMPFMCTGTCTKNVTAAAIEQYSGYLTNPAAPTSSVRYYPCNCGGSNTKAYTLSTVLDATPGSCSCTFTTLFAGPGQKAFYATQTCQVTTTCT